MALDIDPRDMFFPNDEEETTSSSLDKEKQEKKENTQIPDNEDHSIRVQNIQPAINTTAFCPHCGARVRVGVVLLPEE